jgi:hypothetical protein
MSDKQRGALPCDGMDRGPRLPGSVETTEHARHEQ